MMSNLRSALEQIGFLDVTGWQEVIGGKPRRITINPKEKLKLHTKNGVMCVIDGNGHSWIKPNLFDMREHENLGPVLKHVSVSVSICHVPFANDGGHFVREVWPDEY